MRRCDEGSSGTGAGAKQTEGQRLGQRLAREPGNGLLEAAGEAMDVEAELRGLHIDRVFVGCEEVDKQRGETGRLERPRNRPIPPAEAAAPTPMREEDDARSTPRNNQVSLDRRRSNRNFNWLLPDCALGV
jgi:hypothetical protein